jgi:transcriptional regulator PpsR
MDIGQGTAGDAEPREPGRSVLGFDAAHSVIGDVGGEAAVSALAVASDMTLLLDADGVIRDVAFGAEDLAGAFPGRQGWLGRSWTETVTEESRSKVTEVLRDALAGAPPRWRHINQASDGGAAVPVLCTATRLGRSERIVILVFARDLRQISVLQQRLVQAQQAIERDYARLRHAETRYRLLFQMSAEPVLLVDAATLRIAEANPAADRLLGSGEAGAAGRPLLDAFDSPAQPRIEAMLSAVRAAGRAEEARLRLAGGEREVIVSASLLRQDRAVQFLIRLAFPAPGRNEMTVPPREALMLDLLRATPDGFVLAAQDGRILAANAAFLDMVQLPSEEQARGQPLSRFLGRQGVELDVLVANVRLRGPVRLFQTELRGAQGAAAVVEVSASTVLEAGETCFGFSVRDVGARLGLSAGDSQAPGAEPRRGGPPVVGRPVEQLAQLVGRVPLRDLVREATDVIEKLAIEAALELSGDNRASAAEMLGLSRQSLYVKLRRYGLGDLDHEDGA